MWPVCRNQDVPKIETKSWGLLLLLINIFFPGIGSIVAGLKGDRTSTMIIGLLQFVSSWFILGWIWRCPDHATNARLHVVYCMLNSLWPSGSPRVHKGQCVQDVLCFPAALTHLSARQHLVGLAPVL